MIRASRQRRRTAAQAVVEYAICFPIILLFTLAIIQLAHLFIAKHVVSYAAFVAARAAIVDEDYERAADLVCSYIAGPSGVAGADTIDMPGWGPLRGSGAAAVKTHAALVTDVATDYPAVTMEVTHQFELRIPIANTVAYSLGDMLLGLEGLDETTYGAPHITMVSRCTYSHPWAVSGGNP